MAPVGKPGNQYGEINTLYNPDTNRFYIDQQTALPSCRCETKFHKASTAHQAITKPGRFTLLGRTYGAAL